MTASRLILPAAAIAMTLAAGTATAQVATQVDVRPEWLRRPSQDDLMGAWPKAALRDRKEGEALIHCIVSIRGALTDCKVLSESPVGSGFGAAAVSVTPQLLMKPAMKGGQPVAYDGVTMPVRFRSPGVGTNKLPLNPVVSNVRWLQAPTYAEVAAAFPAAAREKKVGGQATVSCEFKDDGHVRNCRVQGETPFGLGFGPAARRLAADFVGPTLRADGEKIGGALVQIPISFPLEMASSAEPITGKPQWSAVPSAEQMQAAIPPGAAAAGVRTARVVMTCKIAGGGVPDACAVDREEPAGQGFGASSLDLAKAFRLSAWSNEGLPTIGGQVQIPLRYDVPEPAKP